MPFGSRRLAEIGAALRGRWWLLLQTWVLLWVVRLSLTLLPFPATRRLAGRLARGGRRQAGRPRPEIVARVARAVGGVSRFVVGGSHCLTQAIATQILLARHAVDSELCFGVAVEETFSAHAWVECDGRVVIGHPGARTYTRLRASLSGRPVGSESDESLGASGGG